MSPDSVRLGKPLKSTWERLEQQRTSHARSSKQSAHHRRKSVNAIALRMGLPSYRLGPSNDISNAFRSQNSALGALIKEPGCLQPSKPHDDLDQQSSARASIRCLCSGHRSLRRSQDSLCWSQRGREYTVISSFLAMTFMVLMRSLAVNLVFSERQGPVFQENLEQPMPLSTK